MTTYWCRFFDASGRIFGAAPMGCASDRDAIARARVVHAHRIGSGYEIWEGERMVARITHERIGRDPQPGRAALS